MDTTAKNDSMTGAGGLREAPTGPSTEAFPRVRHFNRASVLDRVGTDGRTIREACDDIGRGTFETEAPTTNERL